MTKLMRFFVCLAFTMALAPAAWAQSGEEDHGAAVEKMNAYVGFMNRAIRASDSLSRYESWVNMKKGPTGKERIIYGLYAPYDVRTEIAKAEEAIGAEPRMPDLDAAMTRFIAVYKELAPVLEKASKYYDRSDYKSDKMQGGKEFHTQIIKFADEFSTARTEADTLLAKEKRQIDLQELAALEKAEGKKSRWQVRNIMIKAQAVMETLPSGNETKVDLGAYDASLKDYAEPSRCSMTTRLNIPARSTSSNPAQERFSASCGTSRKNCRRPRAMLVKPPTIWSGFTTTTI